MSEDLQTEDNQRVTLRHYLSGKVLTNENFRSRLSVFLYIGLLVLIYMGINFSLQSKYKHLDTLYDRLTELRTIQVTVNQRKLQATSFEEIEKLLKKYKIELIFEKESPEVIK